MILCLVLGKTILWTARLSTDVTVVRHTLNMNLYVTFQIKFCSRVHRGFSTFCTSPNLPLFLNHWVDHCLIGDRGIKGLSGGDWLVFFEIFVVFRLVLHQTALWPAHFSTDVTWPWDVFDMSFCVPLQVRLEKKVLLPVFFLDLSLTLVFGSLAILPQTMQLQMSPFFSIIDGVGWAGLTWIRWWSVIIVMVMMIIVK